MNDGYDRSGIGNILGLDLGGLPEDFGRASGEPKAEPPTHLKLDLLQNGIDFIRSGIENHFLRDEADAPAHKYAVLYMFSGVLLLLKERLRREHASLIFERVEDVGDDDKPTVTLAGALSRLKACAGVSLDTKDVQFLERVRRVRNRLEHYHFELQLKHAQYMVGRMCEFAYFFLSEQLGTTLEDHVSGRVMERVQGLRRIAAHLERRRIAGWKVRARHYKKMKASELRGLLGETHYHPRDNPMPQQVYWCLLCAKETVVGVGGQMAVCTNPKCREVMEADGCMRCGELVLGTRDAWFCENCQAWADAQ